MKTKCYWLVLLVALATTQVQARGFGGGGAHFGGNLGGGHFGGHPAIGHAGVAHAYHAAPMRGLAGSRPIYSRPNYTYNRNASVASHRMARSNAAVAYRNSYTRNFNRTNHLPGNWRSHVYASHVANWHRDWDRGREHWWHGHRCRFVNGSWIVFDAGFDPWWWWPYPDDYYYDGEDDYDY